MGVVTYFFDRGALDLLVLLFEEVLSSLEGIVEIFLVQHLGILNRGLFFYGGA